MAIVISQFIVICQYACKNEFSFEYATSDPSLPITQLLAWKVNNNLIYFQSHTFIVFYIHKLNYSVSNKCWCHYELSLGDEQKNTVKLHWMNFGASYLKLIIMSCISSFCDPWSILSLWEFAYIYYWRQQVLNAWTRTRVVARPLEPWSNFLK